MIELKEVVTEGVAIMKSDNTQSLRAVGRLLVEKYPHLDITANGLRKRIGKQLKNEGIEPVKAVHQPISRPKSEPKPFVLSAWNFDTGKMMDIDEYCTHYNLPKEDILEYKLVTHTGTPYYNTRFRESVGAYEAVDYEEIREILNKELNKTYTHSFAKEQRANKEGVLKWADLHCGAHIEGLLLTRDYNSTILAEALIKSVDEVNLRQYSQTHVHILGDLIESFTGKNHKNSFLSLNKDEIRAAVIRLCCKIIADALKKVVNLGKVKIVGGNHDRLTENNDDDVKGGAAELIAWGLELMGFDVEFHPYVLVHQVEGINHINFHGDKAVSKKPTKDILWTYGTKGAFNFIFLAHLHTIIEDLSVSERAKFKTTTDDAIDHRRMHLAPFFMGNYYSETLGFTSNMGYTIIEDNGNGLPNVIQGAL